MPSGLRSTSQIERRQLKNILALLFNKQGQKEMSAANQLLGGSHLTPKQGLMALKHVMKYDKDQLRLLKNGVGVERGYLKSLGVLPKNSTASYLPESVGDEGLAQGTLRLSEMRRLARMGVKVQLGRQATAAAPSAEIEELIRHQMRKLVKQGSAKQAKGVEPGEALVQKLLKAISEGERVTNARAPHMKALQELQLKEMLKAQSSVLPRKFADEVRDPIARDISTRMHQSQAEDFLDRLFGLDDADNF